VLDRDPRWRTPEGRPTRPPPTLRAVAPSGSSSCPRRWRARAWRACGPGTRVNLERAVAVGGRLGGHIVQGHVDGVATLLRRDPRCAQRRAVLQPAGSLARYVVDEGVYHRGRGVADRRRHRLCVVLGGADPRRRWPTPHSDRGVGDTVNLEVDVVAKYVERLTAGYAGPTVAKREETSMTAVDGLGERAGVPAGRLTVAGPPEAAPLPALRPRRLRRVSTRTPGSPRSGGRWRTWPRGRPVWWVDDADRENDGRPDLRAEKATPGAGVVHGALHVGLHLRGAHRSRLRAAGPAADAPHQPRQLPYRPSP
jgi:hypothetical protein